MTNQCKQCGMLYETNIKYSYFYSGKCDRCVEYHLNREASRYNSLLTTSNGESTSKETISNETRYNNGGDRRTNSHPGGLW